MRIAIYGAGAIGGYLGALLSRSGEDVALVARGPHLAAIKANGLTLEINDERIVTQPAATDDPGELREQDYVIISLKAHSAPSIVDAIQPLLGANTAVVTAANGVP